LPAFAPLFSDGERQNVHLAYSLLTGIAFILTLPYWLIRGLRRGKYLHNLRERLGILPKKFSEDLRGRPAPVWIHAVSVGEVLAAAPLARALKDEHPERPLVVSTTTKAGQELAKERMGFADGFFYFPLDWGWCARRVVRTVRPSTIIIVETEIWPNVLRVAREARVPVIFANGRISSRSFRRYQKWFRMFGVLLRPFLRSVLADASLFLMQTQEDAERVMALGAEPQKVSVTGNLKYDRGIPPESAMVRALGEELHRRERGPVIVAGSVVANEEPLVLIAFGVAQGEWPRALLVLAPRKPERFEAAASFIEESHRKFVRRTAMSGEGQLQVPDDASVVLLDTIGELGGLYRIADAVFIGGSLVPAGGHNILEPAAFGKVPVFGPSMENFQEIAARFLEAGAAVQVHSPEELGVEWIHLLRDGERRQRMGSAARALVESSRGATARTLAQINAVTRPPWEAAVGASAGQEKPVVPPRAGSARP
jgi:3-deoxy-D-manno-octulosonic-acid transferase